MLLFESRQGLLQGKEADRQVVVDKELLKEEAQEPLGSTSSNKVNPNRLRVSLRS